ncbi:MAG: HAMP domain-containing sensor histidine kinase, partial [Balneolaceae bacterium]|nr:HAMP domain-containing sensor histidine kinase [Balneolaceae bacterium]
INNEQVNNLRQLVKNQSDSRPQKKEEADLYEEMSRLNNDLANAQRKLAKKTAELERSNEMKNKMLGMAAHDLRSPLSVIQGFSSILLEDHDETNCFSDDQVELLQEINNSSKFMVRIIEDLLDISAIESGSVNLNLEQCDLAELIRRTVSLNRMEAGKKNITLSTDLPDDEIMIELDPHKFEQVLNNLITNAIKYSHSETTTAVGINDRKKPGILTIYVRDEGQGIPEEEQEKLFQPFSKISVQATGSEKSTGLGLAITKRIVEAHNGEIYVESEPGVGSTFFVDMPR